MSATALPWPGELCSSPLQRALQEPHTHHRIRWIKSQDKPEHGKPGDKRTKHCEMKLMAERSLRSCCDALRSNPSPFLLAGLLNFSFFPFFFLEGNFIKTDLALGCWCRREKQIKGSNATNGNKLCSINWSGAQEEPPAGREMMSSSYFSLLFFPLWCINAQGSDVRTQVSRGRTRKTK